MNTNSFTAKNCTHWCVFAVDWFEFKRKIERGARVYLGCILCWPVFGFRAVCMNSVVAFTNASDLNGCNETPY